MTENCDIIMAENSFPAPSMSQVVGNDPSCGEALFPHKEDFPHKASGGFAALPVECLLRVAEFGGLQFFRFFFSVSRGTRTFLG